MIPFLTFDVPGPKAYRNNSAISPDSSCHLLTCSGEFTLHISTREIGLINSTRIRWKFRTSRQTPDYCDVPKYALTSGPVVGPPRCTDLVPRAEQTCRN
jgi:hypothetical protein